MYGNEVCKYQKSNKNNRLFYHVPHINTKDPLGDERLDKSTADINFTFCLWLILVREIFECSSLSFSFT